MKKIQITLMSMFLTASFSFSQNLKFPAPSPLQTVKQDVGISSVEVSYSRPSAHGRTIFGESGVVPFNQFWRTGANAPTKITFDDDATINGNKVPAGSYSLFTYPDEKEWTVVLNKNLFVYGDADRNKNEDVAVIKVIPQKISFYVETFTMNFSTLEPTKTSLDLLWANTRIPLEITFDYDKKFTEDIEKTMGRDARPYFNAAKYYYENNKDMKKALDWVEIAYINSNYAYYIGVVKAKIQLKLGDKKGANETLKQVQSKGGYAQSVKMEIEDLIKQTK